MDMSNKTSDKNVANIEIIENFILELKDFELNKNTLEVANALEDILAELEQKDKQIDLMAELVYKRFKAELLLEYGFENEDQLKQYFADLVEKE